MKLRVERRHQYGNSNAEQRSKTLAVPPNATNKFETIKFIRATQFITKQQFKPVPPDTKDSLNALMLVQNKNQAHLKGIPTKTNHNVEGNTIDKTLKPLKATRPSRLARLDGDIETRPVYWNQGQNKTLSDDFDISKVINFKKALYYRYCKRKNHGKVFFAWDKDQKGYIDEKDVMMFGDKCGLPLNEKEAKLIVACADIDKNGKLNPKEFMNLIFNQKIVSKVENNTNTNEMTEDQLKTFLMTKLDEITVQETKSKLFNKIQQHKTYLQRVINSEEFNKKDYSINKQKFEDVLSKLSQRDKILNNNEISFLYDQFKDRTDSVNLYDFFYRVKEHENTEYRNFTSKTNIRSYEQYSLL